MISRIKNRALRRAALIVSGPIIAVLGALCVGVGAGAMEAMSFIIEHTRAWLRVWKQ